MTDYDLQTRFQAAIFCEQQGRLEEAETIYRGILAEFPRVVGAMDRLGMLALNKGDSSTALAWFDAALAVQPDFGPAAVNASIALNFVGRVDEAETMLRRAMVLDPRFAAAPFMLSQLLWDRGDYDQACEALGRAMKLAPEFTLENYATLYSKLGDCDWRGLDALKALMTKKIRAGSVISSPLTFMYYSESVADQGQCARSYAHSVYPPQKPLWSGQERKPGKIRVGYMSSDYYNHAVARLMAGVLENHDREKFELFAYSLMPPIDHDIRNRIIPAFDHFNEVAHLDHVTIANKIREDDIDILVNLNGYTLNTRPEIMALRPARIQVSLLGYPGTTGAPYMDYLIADRSVVRLEDMRHYSEKIVWMPHTYQPTDDKVLVASRTPTREAEGLPEDAFVFSAYNPTRKIGPAVFAAWMRILSRVPGSVLWLQDGGEAAAANLRREAEGQGIDPERLVFATFAPAHEDHLARLKLADLYIDTTPYNAHSIASDVMWMGVPVITCRGATFPGRVCAGLVEAAGFPELVTDNLQDYENLAVDLALDRERLAALRERMETEGRSSPLFQTATYTRHLEQAYTTMFERAQKNLPTEYFAVRPAKPA